MNHPKPNNPDKVPSPSRRQFLKTAAVMLTLMATTRSHAEKFLPEGKMPPGVNKAEYAKEGNDRVGHVNGTNADGVHTVLAKIMEDNLTEELHKGNFLITGFQASHGHKGGIFGMEYRIYLRPAHAGEKPHKFITIRGTVEKSVAIVQSENAKKIEQAKLNLHNPTKFQNHFQIDLDHLETNIHAVSATNPGEKFYHEADLILGRPR